MIAVGFTVAGVPVIGLTANGSSSRTWRMLTVAVGSPEHDRGRPPRTRPRTTPNSLIPATTPRGRVETFCPCQNTAEVVGEEDPRRGGKEPERQHEVDPPGQRVGADDVAAATSLEKLALADDLQRVPVDLAEGLLGSRRRDVDVAVRLSIAFAPGVAAAELGRRHPHVLDHGRRCECEQASPARCLGK